MRSDRSFDPFECARREFRHQEPRRIYRSRHAGLPYRNPLEPQASVIGLVTDQYDQPMAVLLRLLERPRDQLASDSALPERRLHGEWPEQEGGRAADADAREPDGADQQRS